MIIDEEPIKGIKNRGPDLPADQVPRPEFIEGERGLGGNINTWDTTMPQKKVPIRSFRIRISAKSP